MLVGRREYRGKRALDLAILAVVALPALVVGALCALAVKLTSRGPVFFRQERVGWGGEVFLVWKFRSLVVGDHSLLHSQDAITPAGRFLRRTSLDELPQLINVLRGEMSIVGPRPTVMSQVRLYDERQLERLSVRPGLTGLAQVSGRNALQWGERIELDLEYVERQSALLDLQLIARTASTVVTGDGVEGHPVDDPLLGLEPLDEVVIDLRERPEVAPPAEVDATPTNA
jgi:lipopolysaccharide/colanic/teichoic acid biosynthesis glycosyltransferase